MADGTRTRDHRDHNPGLYQLSYRHRARTQDTRWLRVLPAAPLGSAGAGLASHAVRLVARGGRARSSRRAPLEADTTADVVIVGGGYLGLWTAWQLKPLEPAIDVVVLEAGLAGHGPSGRNGGFVSTLWDDLPILRDRVGDERAVEVVPRVRARRATGSARGASAQGVDAWYRAAPTLYVATCEAQLGDWDDVVEACAAVGAPEEVAADRPQPRSRRAVRRRRSSAAAILRTSANVQPARLSLGLRATRDRGGRPAPRAHARSRRLDARRGRDDGGRAASVRGAAVLAVNSATASLRGLPSRARASRSSHMVITEPVPDVLEEIGWTGGEPIADCRTLLHYLRTTRDGRIALGWGGGRMGFGGDGIRRLESTRGAVAHGGATTCVRFFPQLRGRRITHAWGGPIDVSPTHLPIFGSRGARPPRLRLHRERRRAVLPRRRDPRPARARPPRRAHRGSRSSSRSAS